MITGKADCGMQYAVKRSGSSVAYCALSIKCGTRDEEGFHSGIAHFVEHTIFKGTERRSAAVINGYLDRLGGELNAFTTKEEIVLHATVLKEDMAKAAALLFELATCPTFPDQELNTEKGVVIDEIQSYKDSPSEDIYDKFEEMLFKGHPLSGNILGGPANNSILNSVLREKNGWVYGVECSYTQYSDTGIVAISLGCDKGNLEKCVKAIHKEIGKLQEETLSDRKLKAAKKQLLGQMAISGDNGETQCLSMGKGLLAYGKLNTGKETRQMVEGITAEDIREMARTIFAPSNLSKLTYI